MPPTQFDLDNLDSWDTVNHAHGDDDDISSLPEDARELYHRLTHDGAASRERIAQIDQRLPERIAQLSVTHLEGTLGPEPELEPEPRATASAPPRSPSTEPLVRRAPRYTASRRWATLLATAAVVIAFVAVLTVSAGHRTGSLPPSHQTPARATSPTSAPTTDWTDLTQLDYSTSFSSNGFPAVAPSNPRVVYETMAHSAHQPGPATLRATSDGGTTWRTLPTPVPAGHIGWAGIVVSPLNPQTIFLSLFDTVVADCPPTSEVNGPGGGIDTSSCAIQYSSFDGGAHWTLTAPTLPVAYGSAPGVLWEGGSIPIVGIVLGPGTHGQRLITNAIYSCPNPQRAACIRLVASDDGGRTWHFADLPMLAGGAADVCDYTASPSSADIYTITTPITCDFRQQAARTLWHSVDGGTTWVKVGQLATPNEVGVALARDETTGSTLLYLAQPVTTSFTKDKIGESIPNLSHSPSDVKVSTDSGATWQSAPTAGIPSDRTAYWLVGLFVSLSDGSIVIEVIPSSTADSVGNFQGGDLYAWKPGDAGWRLIGSVSEEMDGLLVVPAPSGDGDTLYAFLTSSNDTNTFTILRKHVAP